MGHTGNPEAPIALFIGQGCKYSSEVAVILLDDLSLCLLALTEGGKLLGALEAQHLCNSPPVIEGLTPEYGLADVLLSLGREQALPLFQRVSIRAGFELGGLVIQEQFLHHLHSVLELWSAGFVVLHIQVDCRV